MNNEKLNWHPKYKVYRLPNHSIILVCEQEELLFPANKYPLFYQINGTKSMDDIAKSAQSPLQASTFVYLVNQLNQRTNLFLKNSDTQIIQATKKPPEQHNKSVVNLINENFTNQLTPWFEALKKITEFDTSTKIICVDNFIDKTLSDSLENIVGPYILMSFKCDEIQLSPVFFSEQQSNISLTVKQFQQVLLDNKPVINLLQKLFPAVNKPLPTSIPDFNSLCNDKVTKLLKLVSAQFNQHKDKLTILKIDGSVQYHSVFKIAETCDTEFAIQVKKPVVLQPCLVLYNKDGGSRHISPADTLAKLLHLVSPVTGVITHLSEMESIKDYPIKIYKTAFFKTPQLKDINSLDENSFVLTCLGKGVTSEQSKVSALCEAIERYCAHYQANEPLYLARSSELTKRYYDFQQLTPHSQSQYINFNDPNHPDSRLKQATIPYDDENVHWLPCWSLSHKEQVYLPLTCCLANIPFNDDKFGCWHSNGCAAGNTLEEAILQGLFELIERDAAAIWWYNQITRPKFDLTRLDPAYFTPLQKTLDDQHKFWVLDITIDLGIPVMVAVGKNKQTGGFVFGFGCHLQAELAAQRALTELCQLIPIREQTDASFDFDAINDADFLYPQPKIQTISNAILPSNDLKKDILNIINKLAESGFETLVLNYSRGGLPIKTAKVFVPGLCHIWPQFANERLYRVPILLGWLEQANTEATINQQALYI